MVDQASGKRGFLDERNEYGATKHDVLLLLHEKGPLTAGEIEALGGFTRGQASGVLSRAYRHSYVEIAPSPTYGTAYRISERGTRWLLYFQRTRRMRSD